jgi:hypothetical protein
MEPREPEETFADDQHVEISDLPGYEQSRAGRSQAQRTLFRPGPRSLFQAGGVLVLLLFCLALLLSNAPGLRSAVLTVLGQKTTPTAGTGPRIDRLYVNATPPWGALSIDGRPLARLPDPASGQPLHLGPGTHHLIWRAAPFPTRFCTLSVPFLPTDTCSADATAQTPGQHLAWIVSFANSMLTLARTQQDTLNGQIQRTLDSFQASDLVQPGEQFAEMTTASNVLPNSPSPIAVAGQPLHATLHLMLDSQGTANACTSGGTVNACTINERRCGGLCTQSSQGMFWNVLAVVKTSWTYTTLDGRVVATDVADAQGSAARLEHVLALAMRWNGVRWQVQAAAQFFNGPIPCVTASDYAAISDTFGTSPFQAFSWRYIPAPNLAAGCLVVLTSITNGGPSPTASSQILYLHRFGIFIAINRLAQEYNPFLPHPTPYELGLARQLAAQAQIAFS